ncbi:MAG: L-threonylcarbamoyladenylate synthase [Candidatus Micrarchaeales archaeon]
MQDIKTSIIEIDPVNPEKDKIKVAASFIKNGSTVVFPTETVYGIGANAFNGNACAKIFEIKGRPSDNPLIVHVSSLEMAQEIGEIPKKYIDAIKKVWPSPITFIVKAKKTLPKEVTTGLDTVAIRMPAHPVALELIKESKVPIAAPSANPSKKPTATNANQAVSYFNGKVDCIIDSGRAFFGLESTIIDLQEFRILRPGPFTPEEIEKVFGVKPKISEVSKGKESVEHAISPGTKYAHYAPDTPLFLFEGEANALVNVIDNMEEVPEFVFMGSSESCNTLSKAVGCSTVDLGSKNNVYEIAKNLYDSIILLDSMKVKFGVIESFDETGIGLAIMNRIRKATSGKSFSDPEQLSEYIS